MDLALIVPIAEVESGMLYMSGAENVLCTRFCIVHSSMQFCSPSFFCTS
jgi:hypothetical protein